MFNGAVTSGIVGGPQVSDMHKARVRHGVEPAGNPETGSTE
jgi:hypothetical protein